jgi:hypothetical protein
MNKYTNPLNDIKIASPCAANWNKMIGDSRQRHCAECKLNVYNLSEMTQTEAENFLINAEGRVCIKFYHRSDGTVLTRDCPVGWQRLKKRVSKTATAFFSMIVGIFGGLFAFNLFSVDDTNSSEINTSDFNKTANHVFAVEIQKRGHPISLSDDQQEMGRIRISDLDTVKSKIRKSRKR